LTRLRRLELVAAVGCRARARGRPAQLLQVTPRGRTFLAARAGHGADAHPPPMRTRSLPAHQLTGLLACYELLVHLAAAEGGPTVLTGWERPWRRAYLPAPGRAGRRVGVPAAGAPGWPGGAAGRAYPAPADPATAAP